MTTASKTVISNEIDHSLREWGVNRTINDDHRRFHDFAKRQVLECYNPEDHRNRDELKEELKINNFPKEPAKAMVHVLLAELQDADHEESFRIAVDKLGKNFSPYFKGRRTYNKRVGYEKFSTHELDPFNRFTERTFSSKEWFRYIWKDRNSLAGTIFEALVACHAVHSKTCPNCYTNSLRWHGGRSLSSSWADIICIECNSTFEVKSKKDAQAVSKSFEFCFRGGSFRTYYMYPPPEDSKRYLVVVSRTSELKIGQTTKTYPVHLAEIDLVVPRLCGESFLDGKTIKIQSDIKAKLGTNIKWCDVPVCGANHAEVAKEVFERHFGNGSWEGPASPTKDEPRHEPAVAAPKELKTAIEELRKQVEALSAGDAEWDQSSDEDE